MENQNQPCNRKSSNETLTTIVNNIKPNTLFSEEKRKEFNIAIEQTELKVKDLCTPKYDAVVLETNQKLKLSLEKIENIKKKISATKKLKESIGIFQEPVKVHSQKDTKPIVEKPKRTIT